MAAPGQEQLSFGETLADLWRQKKTGVLLVEAAGVKTTVYLRNGVPIFAERGQPDDMIGRVLVESGVLTEAQLSHAIAVLTDRLLEEEQLQLGSVLVELKMVTPPVLYESLAVQVRRKTISCFSAGRCVAEFQEGEEHLAHVTPFEISMCEVLMAGVRASPAEVVDDFLASRGQLFAQLAVPIRDVERDFHLGGQERRFLNGIDGRTTVNELRHSPLGPQRSGQILMALALGNALTLNDKSAATQPAATQPAAAKAAPAKLKGKQFGSARKEGVPPEEEDSWTVRLLDRIKRKDS
jgi:hypothetical protein